MSEQVLEEAHVFGAAVVVGMGLMLVYELLRVFRRVLVHGKGLVALEDLAYWGLFTLVVFEMLRREYEGTLRWFTLTGVAIGLLIFGKLWHLSKKTLKNLWKTVKIGEEKEHKVPAKGNRKGSG